MLLTFCIFRWLHIFTESTKQMLEELEQQKKYLTEQIAVEKLRKPLMKPKKVRNWLYKLRTLNPEKLEHRRVLVDTFVNKIFLYDDKIIFTFNYKGDTKEVTLKEVEDSDILTGREPVNERRYAKAYLLFFTLFVVGREQPGDCIT